MFDPFDDVVLDKFIANNIEHFKIRNFLLPTLMTFIECQ